MEKTDPHQRRLMCDRLQRHPWLHSDLYPACQRQMQGLQELQVLQLLRCHRWQVQRLLEGWLTVYEFFAKRIGWKWALVWTAAFAAGWVTGSGLL